MNKPTKPNITIPASFGGVKVDFDNNHLRNGFPQLTPDVLPGDCLNKLIDDTYKGLNYAMAGTDAINLIQEDEVLTVKNGELVSSKQAGGWTPPLLQSFWTDHLLNRMDMLRSDTFSWQSGTTYSSVYNELLSEYNNSASVSTTEGSITFKRTPKGYKIALATQESAIAEKYATDGIAWYYILDTTNKKFKLPRAKHPSLVTLTNSVPVYGNGMSLGLTEGTHYGSLNSNSQGALVEGRDGYGQPVGSSNVGLPFTTNKSLGITTDPTKSGIVADLSSNVKDYSMYLYFYVGNFTKSAEAQTAGLNSELFNGKVDKSDLAEIYPVIKTYVNGTSWYRIWSDGWCEQGGRLYNAKDVANTITLLKTMKDTNYSVFIAHGVTGVHNDTAAMKRAEEPFNFTATSFQVYTHPSEGLNTVQWKVCGYLAEGWNNEGIS